MSPTPPASTPTVGEPWTLPEDDLRTQRLYRVRLAARDEKGEEQQGRFRLTLRLEREKLFQLSASDPLGRSLWTLHVEGERGTLLDYREKRVCTYGGEVDLTRLQLGPFPIERLPIAILGRLPSGPAPGEEVERVEERQGVGGLIYRDLWGRRWRVRLEGGLVKGWNMEPLGGEEGMVISYREDDDGWRRLHDPREGLTLEWREVVREAAAGPPSLPDPPEKFSRGGCDNADPNPGK